MSSAGAPTRSPLPRDARIDLLRGIAVALVLLLHFSLTYRLPAGPLGRLFTPKAVAMVVMNGNYGVTLFFVISGFLITSNSLRRYGTLARIDRRSFYVQRAARILPPLLPVLALITVLGLCGVPSFLNKVHGEVMPASYFLVAIGSVLTFWHNVLMASTGYFNYALNIYWSLSVEEVFYLLFPVLCTLLRKWMLLAVAVAVVIIGPVYRHLHVDDEVRYLYGYLACFDAIALGFLTAVIGTLVRLPSRVRFATTWAAAIGLAAFYLAGIGGHEVFGFTAVALCTALLLLTTKHVVPETDGDGPCRALSFPLDGLRWMGRHSYELYLYHIVLLGLLRDALPREAVRAGWQLPLLAVFMAASCGIAALVARYIAKPMNAAIRRRWSPRRTADRHSRDSGSGQG